MEVRDTANGGPVTTTKDGSTAAADVEHTYFVRTKVGSAVVDLRPRALGNAVAVEVALGGVGRIGSGGGGVGLEGVR